MLDGILNVLAPHRCASCGEIGAVLCSHCKYNIESEPYGGCVVCGSIAIESGICQKCSPGFAVCQAWCVGERRDSLKALGDRYKFDNQRAAARPLAELLDACLPVLPPNTAVVGIPANAHSVRVRGFDHVGLIVKHFSALRKLEIARPLRRNSQATLHYMNKKDREKLADSLFLLRADSAPKRVLLLDDIITTGTTLRAAAKLLRQAGVEELYVAAIARQPK